ncbi:MAG: sulfotransferase domain-containing protein [Xenococcus sp. (in: cyanobacteria)]
MSQIVELSSEQELALERNLVWIFASPRSGTTWTSVQLLSHQTKLMGEPLIGSHLADARELGDTYIRRYEEQAEREPYFFSAKYKHVWQHYVRKLILHRIYAQFQDISSTIIIKEPNGSMAADLISDCLPQSKILIIFRDGRDVVNSLITALSKGGYAEKNSGGAFEPLAGARRRTSIILNSRRWAKLVKVLSHTYENHDEKLRYLIRYEQLLENTYQEVQKVYKFIGIDISEDKLASIIHNTSVKNIPSEQKGIGTTIQFAKAGVWKQRFDDEEKQIIQGIIGDGLKKLGYLI